MAQLDMSILAEGKENSQNVLSEAPQMPRSGSWVVLAASYTSVAQCLLPRHRKARGDPASL